MLQCNHITTRKFSFFGHGFVNDLHLIRVHTAFKQELVIGVLNATLGFVLKVITFPFAIVTFGVFLLVINALMILLVKLTMVFMFATVILARRYGLAGSAAATFVASVAVLLIGFSQTAGDARVFAARHGYRIEVNQESVAEGMSNLGSGLFQGMPVSTTSLPSTGRPGMSRPIR